MHQITDRQRTDREHSNRRISLDFRTLAGAEQQYRTNNCHRHYQNHGIAQVQEQNIAQMLENPFMQYNHIEIVSVTSDSAVMSLDIRRDTTNIYGYVHGGAFFTMADCCAGLTARSDGRQYVTQNASVNFIHKVKAGHLTARGRTVSRRRHICVVAVEITDETDALLFSSTFSMYCISAEG